MRIKFKSLPLTFYVGVCLNSFGSINYTVPLTGYRVNMLLSYQILEFLWYLHHQCHFVFLPLTFFLVLFPGSGFTGIKLFQVSYKNLRANLPGKACVSSLLLITTQCFTQNESWHRISARDELHAESENTHRCWFSFQNQEGCLKIIWGHRSKGKAQLAPFIRIMIASYRAMSQNKGRCKSKVKANERVMNRLPKVVTQSKIYIFLKILKWH